MNILVTGGAGFLGSHLCLKLLNIGNEVTCVDDLSTGTKANLTSCRDFGMFRFIQADVRSFYDDNQYDQIYHLACPASPPAYRDIPLKTLDTCYNGTKTIVEMAEQGVSFLFTSTSEVYGDPIGRNHPQKEIYRGNVNTVGPRACYDEGKRVAETLLYESQVEYNFPLRVVRLFNTYGPGMDPNDGRVVSNFVCQALRGDDLTVYGDGVQTRSLCYVDDMIDALIKTMNHDAAMIGPMNLGNPHEVTILELANIVLELTGSKSKIVHETLPEDDPTRRCPNIKLATSTIGWKPTTDLKSGLQKTIAWFREAIK